MTAHPLTQTSKPIHLVYGASVVPSRFVEYAYYASIFYANIGSFLGLSVNFLGVGMLAVLAASCVFRLRSRRLSFYAPLGLPLALAISYIVVQLAVHGESLMDDYVRFVLPWILTLIIVQSLLLRQGFLHRFAFAMLVIGLLFLPYLDLGHSGERAGLERGIVMGNPTGLASWFGFCFVYFTIVGFATRSGVIRFAAWLIAVGCLFIVALTVSRGPLFASAIAVTFALRRLLKRGFVPVLIVMTLSWIGYVSGLFQEQAVLYSERLMEETGRGLIWPLALERFLSSPLIGVGASEVATYVYAGLIVPPHNSFIFFALASGVIPLAFYMAYWLRAIWGVLCSNREPSMDVPFRIPLLIYAFLNALINDLVITLPWMIVTLCTAMAAGRIRRIVVRPMNRARRVLRSNVLGGVRDNLTS